MVQSDDDAACTKCEGATCIFFLIALELMALVLVHRGPEFYLWLFACVLICCCVCGCINTTCSRKITLCMTRGFIFLVGCHLPTWIALNIALKIARSQILAYSYGSYGMEQRGWMNFDSPLPWLVSLPFLLVPAVVALNLPRAELKFDLITAGAHSASAIMCLLTARFSHPTFALALFYIITCSSSIGMLCQFEFSIFTTCAQDSASATIWACRRIDLYGLHQVFPECGKSPDKFAINLLAACCLAVLSLVMPVVTIPLSVAKALVFIVVGTCLHSVRLMQVPCVARFFAHLVEAGHASSEHDQTPLVRGGVSELEAQRADMAPESSQAYEIRSHMRALLLELVLASIPSFKLNAMNIYHAYDTETPWAALVSMSVSAHMFIRFLYKLCYHGQMLDAPLRNFCLVAGGGSAAKWT